MAVALENGAFAGAVFEEQLANLLTDPAAFVGIDIPLGHSERGPREADVLARDLLGSRAATVFHAPTPSALLHDQYEPANEIHFEITGKKIQPPAWALREKMREAARAWWAAPQRVLEVHPEVCFAAICGSPVAAGKKTWAGHTTRRNHLAAVGIDIPDDVASAGQAGTDDVLDAAAAAWTANRIGSGDAVSLPDPPERDDDGRAVAIWY